MLLGSEAEGSEPVVKIVADQSQPEAVRALHPALLFGDPKMTIYSSFSAKDNIASLQ